MEGGWRNGKSNSGQPERKYPVVREEAYRTAEAHNTPVKGYAPYIFRDLILYN